MGRIVAGAIIAVLLLLLIGAAIHRSTEAKTKESSASTVMVTPSPAGPTAIPAPRATWTVPPSSIAPSATTVASCPIDVEVKLDPPPATPYTGTVTYEFHDDKAGVIKGSDINQLNFQLNKCGFSGSIYISNVEGYEAAESNPVKGVMGQTAKAVVTLKRVAPPATTTPTPSPIRSNSPAPSPSVSPSTPTSTPTPTQAAVVPSTTPTPVPVSAKPCSASPADPDPWSYRLVHDNGSVSNEQYAFLIGGLPNPTNPTTADATKMMNLIIEGAQHDPIFAREYLRSLYVSDHKPVWGNTRDDDPVRVDGYDIYGQATQCLELRQIWVARIKAIFNDPNTHIVWFRTGRGFTNIRLHRAGDGFQEGEWELKGWPTLSDIGWRIYNPQLTVDGQPVDGYYREYCSNPLVPGSFTITDQRQLK